MLEKTDDPMVWGRQPAALEILVRLQKIFLATTLMMLKQNNLICKLKLQAIQMMTMLLLRLWF